MLLNEIIKGIFVLIFSQLNECCRRASELRETWREWLIHFFPSSSSCFDWIKHSRPLRKKQRPLYLGSVAKRENGEGTPLTQPSFTTRLGSRRDTPPSVWFFSRGFGEVRKDSDGSACPFLWDTYTHGGRFQATWCHWAQSRKEATSQRAVPGVHGSLGWDMTWPGWGPCFLGQLTVLTKEAIAVMLCFKIGPCRGLGRPVVLPSRPQATSNKSPRFSIPSANTES